MDSRSSIWAAILGVFAFVPAANAQIFDNVTLSAGFSPDPTELRGVSGGTVPAKQVAEQAETPTGACVGFVDAEPDHTVTLKSYFDYLRLQIDSPDDTTLVVRGPGGTWCNDDFQDKNAGVEGQWLAGTYQVWVGSYVKDRAIPYTLRISATR